MKGFSIEDRQLLASLKRNRRRYKAELKDFGRTGIINKHRMAALPAKIAETEALIRDIESRAAVAARLEKAPKRLHLPSKPIVASLPCESSHARMSLGYHRSRFDRLFYIAGKLRRNEPINVLREARELGLSRKMLRRDFDLLRAMGWMLEFDRGENSYILLSAPSPRLF